MSHRQRSQTGRIDVSSPATHVPTVHCRIVNKHVPLPEAVANHKPGGEYCFACGKSGDECIRQSKIRSPG